MKKKKKIGLDLLDCEENLKDLMKANSSTKGENCLENILLYLEYLIIINTIRTSELEAWSCKALILIYNIISYFSS